MVKMSYSTTKQWRKRWWKEYYKKNRKHILERCKRNSKLNKDYRKKWRKENKDKIKQYHKNYRLKYPEKFKSYGYFEYHNKRKQQCEICNHIGKLYFHHIDYEKNLGITLCIKCHTAVHNKQNELIGLDIKEISIIQYALEYIHKTRGGTANGKTKRNSFGISTANNKKHK